jgi:hypothetical protein
VPHFRLSVSPAVAPPVLPRASAARHRARASLRRGQQWSIGDATQLRWDMQITLRGRKRRLAKGEFEITGDGVTGADAAPINRPIGYGRPVQPITSPWKAARLTFGEEQVTVQIVDAELVAPLTKQASDAAVSAADSRDKAALSAGAAQGAARYFTTRAAGEAASATDQAFATDDGAGNVIYYRRTASGSVEIGRALTPASLAAPDGSVLVGYRGPGRGAYRRTAESRLSDQVSVKDFGAIADGGLHSVAEWIIPGARGRFPSFSALQAEYPHVTDTGQSIDWAAIQAAFSYAGSLSIDDTPVDSYAYALKGGADVSFPAGVYMLGNSPTLEIPQNVSLSGAGSHSSMLRSDFNGQILRNSSGTEAGTGSYNREGTAIRDMGIIGNELMPLQDGLSLLRWVSGVIDNVHITKCGRDGVVLRECVSSTVDNLMVTLCRGRGLLILRGKDSTWESPDGAHPSNAVTFDTFRAIANFGPGVEIIDFAHGIVFNESFVEYNNGGGTENDGYQIVIKTDSYVPIVFNELWSEGDRLAAHIFMNAPSAFVQINGWRHFAHNDKDGNALVNRALVALAGVIAINNGASPKVAYPTIAGSNAPFRITPNAVSLDVINHKGAQVSGIELVEKPDGSRVGLDNELFQFGRDAIYGNIKMFSGAGAVSALDLYTDNDRVHPWVRFEAFYKALTLGDVSLKRVGQRTLGLDNRGGAQFIDLGSAWNGNHGVMGGYHLWIDANGRLRIKFGAPTADTDGSLVGTQA